MQKEAYYLEPSLGGGTGVSGYLTGDKARTGPQVAYPAVKQKAKAAAAVSRAGYEEREKAKCLRSTPKQALLSRSLGTATTRGSAGTI
jgi:hypothetical protein